VNKAKPAAIGMFLAVVACIGMSDAVRPTRAEAADIYFMEGEHREVLICSDFTWEWWGHTYHKRCCVSLGIPNQP
jgi:hypothetical protein